MAFRDPFAAYNAASNVEAHLICGALIEAGVEAMVVEDVSQVGVWLGGLVSEIHKPQVWIERTDIARAKPVLDEYERRAAGRRVADQRDTGAGEPVEVTCEECGKRAVFPAGQKGSVQSCPHCRAYVDVGDEVGFEGWEEAPGEGQQEA
ncbi:MAG: hypothetical protein JWO38_5838 [Gemmataceae bacterium]|nr:hypothetical protein [Gemmataceae bacterium]